MRQLHDELEELDFLVPPTERRNSLYGPGTRKAVMDLQREEFVFASRVKGIVDQATANLISNVVARSGRIAS